MTKLQKLTHKSPDWLKPIWRRGALRGDEVQIAIVTKGFVCTGLVWIEKGSIVSETYIGRNELWIPVGNLSDAQILASYPGPKWEETPVTKTLETQVLRELREVLSRHNVRLVCDGPVPKLTVVKPNRSKDAYIL